MSISLKQARAFVTLAESRTYAEAANKLHLSQPALSLAIKALEESIGGSLLKRTTRAFSLTPEGQAFLVQVKALLGDWDTTVETVKDRFQLKSGQVSIAVMPTFAATLLPKVLKMFKDSYPKVTISLNDVIAEEAVEMVRKGKVEVGISFRPKITDDVDFKPLFTDHFVAVFPSNYKIKGDQAVSLKEVLSQPLLLLQNPSLVTELINETALKHGLSCKSDMKAHQLATIGRMVSEGLGVSIVPQVCAQQMNEMGAICRPLKGAEISSEIGVLTLKRHALSAAAIAFISAVEQTFN